jgi:hypothetical protein
MPRSSTRRRTSRPCITACCYGRQRPTGPRSKCDRRFGQLQRGTPTRDRTAEPRTSARPPQARPTPPIRRRPAGSPVGQRSADTVTYLAPFFPRRFAGQDPSCPSLKLGRPRLLNCRCIVVSRPLNADQELGDQARTLLLGEREGFAKQRLRVIGHGASVPPDGDTAAVVHSERHPVDDVPRLPRRCLGPSTHARTMRASAVEPFRAESRHRAGRGDSIRTRSFAARCVRLAHAAVVGPLWAAPGRVIVV